MILNLLKETEALLEGHFLLSSGRHSNRYVQCAKLLQYPDKAEIALRTVTEKIKNIEFDIIVGPAMGGILVAYELGRQTGKPSIFTEREEGVMTIRRGFEITAGQRVLIAEDVVTTGKSSLEVAEIMDNLGGQVVGIACIVDRSTNNVSYPIYSAVKLDIKTYEENSCPLCKSNIPIIKPGSRKINK